MGSSFSKIKPGDWILNEFLSRRTEYRVVKPIVPMDSALYHRVMPQLFENQARGLDTE